MTNAITLNEIERSFGDTIALDSVSFTVSKNSICGILGRNGAGKTTIMSLIAGHDRPDSGTVEVYGEEPYENQPTLRQLCFIRDNQRYPDSYSLKQILRAAPEFFPNWNHELAKNIIQDFQISAKKDIRKFSRGQLSAVAILIGLASRAPVTLFDEPYLGLDATARNLFYDYLISDMAEHPRTILMSTHLIDEMEPLLEQVIIIDQGAVVVDSDVDAIKESVTTVSGITADLDNFLLDRNAISHRRVGGLSTAVVKERFSRSDREKYPQINFESPSLQDVVAAYGDSKATSTSATSAYTGA